MKRTIGIVFGGQGHQRVGMSRELLQQHPQAREVFDEASEAVGQPLLRFVQEGPQVAKCRLICRNVWTSQR